LNAELRGGGHSRADFPFGGGHGYYVVKRGARQLFQCNACRKQTSVKAGTIFASSKLALGLWFRAMYLVRPQPGR
jgi:hypothetical protein